MSTTFSEALTPLARRMPHPVRDIEILRVAAQLDGEDFLASLQIRAITAVIPPKSNRIVKRDCDFALYQERNLVARFFNTIKHFRSIATRYEKTARNFLAALHLVCTLSWLK